MGSATVETSAGKASRGWRSALLRLAFAACLACPGSGQAANALQFCGDEATPCARYGAQVFQTRCALCHGSDGMGGELIPPRVSGYPAASLLKPRHARGAAGIRRAIVRGSGVKGTGSYMPPLADELTLTQIESAVLFVARLRGDTEDAVAMLRSDAAQLEPSASLGRELFQGRCALCHGAEGRADGRLAAVIKDPPPFDLTRSTVADGYLHDIISKGGAAMGRSSRMPPWGSDLNAHELASIILHVKSLRSKPQ